MNILGVSALYHDSAACLVKDGEIVAATQEERFTRRKHDPGMPYNAISYCLHKGGIKHGGIDAVVFYDKPITKFARLLTTYAEHAPLGLKSFLMATPAWIKEKSMIPYKIEKHLKAGGFGKPGEFLFSEHHLSHAASAFYPSPFERAAIVTLDGVGEWATTAVGMGQGNHLSLLFEQRFPHSLGLLYSAFTYFTGFKVNSGEYKLMGLAPYGNPVFVDRIKDNLIEIREDGSYKMNMEYFDYMTGFTMTSKKFDQLFDGPPRRPESKVTRREMDLAASIQVVTEEIILKIARYARAITGMDKLCLAGGVALNCVANGKLARSGIFSDIWVQPASGDAGGALGAALYAHYNVKGAARNSRGGNDHMKGAYLGPSFSRENIKEFLDSNGLPYKEMPLAERDRFLARAISEEKVVGLCQGRMEFGPRALGHRSIIADARSKKMQSYLNLATKFRESFRPFAPIVMEEDASRYFEAGLVSPYMLMVDHVRFDRRLGDGNGDPDMPLNEWVNMKRSDIPAITHVDYSARVQTVTKERSPMIYGLLEAFRDLTGCSVLINTSFNVRSEPIVCTPEDAYRCFMRTGMDYLALDGFVLDKKMQPELLEEMDWREEFELD